MGVKVAGMCWVSTTGTLSVRPSPCTRVNSACGPPVELPTASSRGGTIAAGRRRSATVARTGWATRRRMRPRPFTFSTSSRRNVSSPCHGRGLRHIVGRAQPQRAQRDVGAARGQRRGHDDLQTGIGAQQQRQRGHAVHHRHLDVEHHAHRPACASARRAPPGRWRPGPPPAPPDRPPACGRRRRGSPPKSSHTMTRTAAAAVATLAVRPGAITAGRPARTCRSGSPRRTAS